MKTRLLCAGLLVAAATQAGANTYNNGQTIVVSCFRGPWKEVIIDRPNGKFVDSLVAAGYSQPAAQAVGDRICRDQSMVDNLENMMPEIKRIISNAPKS